MFLVVDHRQERARFIAACRTALQALLVPHENAWEIRFLKGGTRTGEVHHIELAGDDLTKLPNDGGVLFKKGTKQALTWPVDKDVPYLHRWWLVIARCHSVNNTGADNVSVLCVNGAEGGPVHRQPQVCFKPPAGTFVSRLHDGKLKSEEGQYSTDFDDWNVMVGYRRGFVMQAVVNGVKTAGQAIHALKPNLMKSQSFMGDVNKPMRADVAIDCVIIGQSELNDAQIDKLVGWAMWRARRLSHHSYF